MNYYMLGECCFEKNDYENAVLYYQKGVEEGEVECMNALAYCFDEGIGVKRDSNKAFELYQRAAGIGYGKAQRNLALYYQERKQEKMAFVWFKQAALSGMKDCVFKVAVHYEDNNDLEEAKKWYKQSAELNNPYAAMRLAKLNEDCFEEALIWYKKAADLGMARAQAYYGFCLSQKECYEEAVRYYTLAAKQKNKDAMVALGHCYVYGKGVEKNYDYGMQLLEESGVEYAIYEDLFDCD